jgi:dihydroorotate dehydrogenase
MAGAQAVQVGTAIRSNGPVVLTKIADEMRSWLGSNGFDSLSQVQGILVGGGRG